MNHRFHMRLLSALVCSPHVLRAAQRQGVCFVATEVRQPGPETLAYQNSRRVILLDDGLGVSDPKPARYPAPGALPVMNTCSSTNYGAHPNQ